MKKSKAQVPSSTVHNNAPTTSDLENRSSFSGKIGFVLAAAGSAVGLGNIWRFPYLAAENGGGIFLVVYIILAVTFGFALMSAEILIGRKTGLSPIEAFKKLDKRFSFIGVLATLVPVLVLPYYSVIGGWVIKYFTVSVSGKIGDAAKDNFFSAFRANDFETLLFFSIFIGLTALIVFFGVEKGIEKTSKVMMPILIVFIVGISV
jgi:NSS family neurotransmitter:Na+ symporter